MGARHRVALITSSFAPHAGGVETHVAHVASDLAERGHDVEVWTVDRGLRPDASDEPCKVRYLATPLPARSLRAVGRFAVRAPGAWIGWEAAHRSLRPDILHIHCFGPNGLYALGLSRRFRIPLIVTSHGETLADDHSAFAESALLRAGLRSAVDHAAAVTAPTRFVLEDLRRTYGLRDGLIVPNGVDLDVAPSIVNPASSGEPYVLGVGRLGRNKGFDLLIDAFARIEPSRTRLVIIGDGPERRALEAQIAELRLGDRVRMTGALDASQVAAAMAGATAVVVPSRVEAFGIVALEAWRSGAPLIMTNRGGAAEFVRDPEDGLLVDPTDIASLASVIGAVLQDPGLRDRLIASGRRRVQGFTWGSVAEEYTALYDEIASDTRARRRRGR